MKLNWHNLTKLERSEYIMMQMAPAYGRRSSYLSDDCTECPICGQPVFGAGWCSCCLDRFEWLGNKLSGKTEPLEE